MGTIERLTAATMVSISAGPSGVPAEGAAVPEAATKREVVEAAVMEWFITWETPAVTTTGAAAETPWDEEPAWPEVLTKVDLAADTRLRRSTPVDAAATALG